MGRHYTGDINGKFWFAVQESTDASFFGGDEIEPNYIEYSFDTDHLPGIRKGLSKCHAALGEYESKLDDFFRTHDMYNDTQLAEAIGIAEDKLNGLLAWYARLELGTKIEQCVAETGSCSFEAELG